MKITLILPGREKYKDILYSIFVKYILEVQKETSDKMVIELII